MSVPIVRPGTWNILRQLIYWKNKATFSENVYWRKHAQSMCRGEHLSMHIQRLWWINLLSLPPSYCLETCCLTELVLSMSAVLVGQWTLEICIAVGSGSSNSGHYACISSIIIHDVSLLFQWYELYISVS